MKISVDTDRCVGSGQCSRAVPQVFDQDDEDGTSVLLVPLPPPELHAGVRLAVDICPVRALAIVESPVGLESDSTGSDDHVTSHSHLPSVREGTAP